MLVYANHLSLQGTGAEEAIFKAIGGWLKEQLGSGLHPDQLRQEGEFEGHRGDVRSWLRIYATNQEEPELYAWVLKKPDSAVRGRQWITELGLKSYRGAFELSCIVKADEHSTLVASPVMASQPRVIRYVVNNVQQADNVDFAASVSGVTVKHVGEDRDSYRGLLAEIERRDRDCPIVLVSPTRDGEYLVNVTELQQKLIGLGQVVQVSREFNSYEMSDVLGESRSAWSGAVNILNTPLQTGFVRPQRFLSDEIRKWGDGQLGDAQQERISQLLAWVTNNTNIPRLRKHVRPEGVMQLALRRRMQTARARSERMDTAQLRQELEEADHRAEQQAKYFDELVEENSQLEGTVSEFKGELAVLRDDLAKKDFDIQALKDQLAKAGGRTKNPDAEALLDLTCRTDPPSPLECVELIESLYGDRCIVLASAKTSAQDVNRFIYGRQLLDMLRRLVTQYRSKLLEGGGDSEARRVFGKGEYAAKESETVMGNKTMRRKRTFEYEGKPVEMFSHLKIGVDEDVAKTIRVHFHWDSEREKIVIGYCGKHFPISSR